MPDRRQTPRRIDRPEPCFLKLRQTRHGPYVPARVFWRLGVLAAEIDGAAADVEQCWSSGDLISEREWRTLTADRARTAPF
jgi:hypothetical protein